MRNISTILNADVSHIRLIMFFLKVLTQNFKILHFFFNLWRMGKGRKGLVTSIWNFIYTYIQTSTRVPETEDLQESKKCSKSFSLTVLNISKCHDYLWYSYIMSLK